MTDPRVLIADDHQAIRVGVRDSLEADGCIVCAEADNADDAVRLAKIHRPDVCLIDIGMPGNGIRAVREIKEALPGTSVLMLTVSSSSEDLFDALRAGADGYLLKDIEAEQLPVEIRAAAAGEVVIQRALTARLVAEFRHRGGRTRISTADGRSIELTSREWDVLELLAEGMTTAQLASRLFLRPITVRRHVSNIAHKLKATSREDAVRLFRERSEDRPRRSDG